MSLPEFYKADAETEVLQLKAHLASGGANTWAVHCDSGNYGTFRTYEAAKSAFVDMRINSTADVLPCMQRALARAGMKATAINLRRNHLEYPDEDNLFWRADLE